MVTFPQISRTEDAAPLRACIEHAAGESGLKSGEVAILMTHFLEALVAEVAKGRPLRIPGFGLFVAARVDHPAALAKDRSPRCLPRFSASRAFRNEVRWGAAPTDAGKRVLARHQRNHSEHARADKGASRSHTALAAFRKSISAQLRDP